MNDTQLATVYRDRDIMTVGLKRLAAQANHYEQLGLGTFRALADMAGEILAQCERTIEVPVLVRRLDQFPAGSVIPCAAYRLDGDDYRCLTVGRGDDVAAACERAYQADPVTHWEEDEFLYRRVMSTPVGEVVDVLVLVRYDGTPEPARPTCMCQGSRVLVDEYPPAME